MHLSIIIPVHNRRQFTYECLLSLKNQTFNNFNIIIIDDGSIDGTEEMLQTEFPEVIILKGDGNLWWTSAVNLGVKYALDHHSDYILTLNNDTVATKSFLEKMLFWAEKLPTSLLGAFALDANTYEPVYGGEIIDWKLAKSKKLLNILSKEQWFGLHMVSHFPGRGLLIPSNVFKKIGFYDSKHFPHYAADYDFTHRAIKAGFMVYCNYDAKLFIYPDASGDAENRKKKSFKNYYNHLFGINGGGNLKVFFFYTLLNCPRKYILLSLPIGLLRRIGGYVLEWSYSLFLKRNNINL